MRYWWHRLRGHTVSGHVLERSRYNAVELWQRSCSCDVRWYEIRTFMQ